MPDFLTAETVDKAFLSYGNELCSAWLYVGKNGDIAKNTYKYLYTDCRMRLIDEKAGKEYKSGNVNIKFYKTENGAKWRVESGAFSLVVSQNVFTVKTNGEEWNSVNGWKSIEYLADRVVFKGRTNNSAATAKNSL